jgi:exopolysaccharide production protein ExoQ
MIAILLVSIPFVRSWLTRSRLNPLTWLLGTALVGAAVGLVVTRRDELLDALGRSDTLSGRTTLWSSAFDSLGKHPWLGFGYGGFWVGNEGASNMIRADVGWMASHAHNGYLDLCLDLGIVGLILFLVGFCVNCAYTIARLRKGFSATRLWPLLFLMFTFLYNFVERTILFRNGISWVLYVATVLSSPEEPGDTSAKSPSS